MTGGGKLTKNLFVIASDLVAVDLLMPRSRRVLLMMAMQLSVLVLGRHCSMVILS